MKNFENAASRYILENFEFRAKVLPLSKLVSEIYYDYKNKTVENCRQNGLKILPKVTQKFVQDWETHIR